MTPPAWLREVEDEMVKLLSLEAGWDSYGALQVDPAQVVSAIALLRRIVNEVDTSRPSVVPTNKGGVQLEWHERGTDLEIEMCTDGTIGVLAKCRNGLGFEEYTEDGWVSDWTLMVFAKFLGENNG